MGIFRCIKKSDSKWGYYDACLRKNHSYTSLMIVGTPLSTISYGFCHSKDCTT